jgi:hypothetical protein
MASLKAKRSARGQAATVLPPAGEDAVRPGIAEIVVGTIAFADDAGQVFVDFPGNAAGAPLRAEVAGHIDAGAIGRSVALTFIGGDPARPFAIGLVRRAEEPVAEPPTVSVQRDGERLLLTARQEIVLQCGKASITLTRAGKVLVRGAYVSLRSSGMQRITGASVHIN